ncbi:hypothetical protein [Lederbergia graminis]|uniref:NADH dehydrogenase subunit 4 n=1 Tax=Lederbergia graminis TaxID=735518 RepID=A0ABW0LH33_9BACI
MENFLLKIFGLVYLSMILSPIIFYLLKKRVLFIVNISVLFLYLTNWFWMIGRVGYGGMLYYSWQLLFYLSIILFFLALSILLLKHTNRMVLTLTYFIGLILVIILKVDTHQLVIFATSSTFLAFIVAFIFSLFHKLC